MFLFFKKKLKYGLLGRRNKRFFFLFFFVVQTGVNKLADLVGLTLGPKGRNVVLEIKYGSPKIAKEVFHVSTFHLFFSGAIFQF